MPINNCGGDVMMAAPCIARLIGLMRAARQPPPGATRIALALIAGLICHSLFAAAVLAMIFVIGPEGEGQLVNYRVRKNYYIVDRLFAAAELRLGGRSQQTVRITRNDGGWFW